MDRKIYINAIKQISVQQPLVDNWFTEPIVYHEPYVKAIDVDYKPFLSPNVARRLGKILKRALIVSKQVMQESNISQPEAIITATGLGCIENTEIFLDKMVREGEQLLNPTHFMQSTHNTIGSLIAIDAKCHAYNTTYAHKGISFESALQDAYIQLQNGRINSALVGAHDEMTPAYFELLKKGGYLGKANQVFASEVAVSMMLSTEKSNKTLCEVKAVETIYVGSGTHLCETHNKLQSHLLNLNIPHLDYIMVGINGDAENDNVYIENCAKLFPNIPLLQYKNVFGEGYTVPALGVYASALCLQKQEVPGFLFVDESRKQAPADKPTSILCYNHFENKNHTFVLLST